MAKITFQPFRNWFYQNHKTKKQDDFLKETGLAPATAYKIFHDAFDYFRSDVLEKICAAYNLSVDQVIEYPRDSRPYAVYFNEDGLPHKVKDVSDRISLQSEDGHLQLLEETGADEIVVAPSPEHAAIEALKRRING